jgi:hypothetical protein
MLTLVKYQKTPIHPFGLNATLDVFNTDICMKLFNTTSLKFNEQDGANMQSIEAAHVLCSVMTNKPDHSMLYKQSSASTDTQNYFPIWVREHCRKVLLLASTYFDQSHLLHAM